MLIASDRNFCYLLGQMYKQYGRTYLNSIGEQEREKEIEK